MQDVTIGQYRIGGKNPCFRIAEIGINHNGDLDIAARLIKTAAENGFQAVKFQKRTVDVVYTPAELAQPRESPFGATNGDLKRGLEFDEAAYRKIDQLCRQHGVLWFASPWDVGSVDFLEKFDPPAHKIASASMTDRALLERIKATGRPVIMSTGMSTLDQVDAAVALMRGSPLILLHTTSTYPCKDSDLNLSAIPVLRDRYDLPVGYSGHETGIMPTIYAVVAYGACVIERHVTLDRAMWGSDQAASVEPRGLELIDKYLNLWPIVQGDGVKRVVDAEVPIQKKLRRVTDF